MTVVESVAAGRPISLLHVVETPENVVLTYRLAGPAARLMAYLVDLAIRAGIMLVAWQVVGVISVVGSFGISMGLMLVVFFMVDWLYFGLLEGFWRGKTLGKHSMGLRVVHVAGYPISLWEALLRNFVRAMDSVSLYGVGLVAMLVAGKFRRLGDLVAQTVVVEERRATIPREPIILERIQPLPRAELGGYVPAAPTLALIEQFLGRRKVLTHRRGHEMASVLAKVLAARLDYKGERRLVDDYPMAFLARVFATFHAAHDEEPYQSAEHGPAGGPRAGRQAGAPPQRGGT